LTGTVRGTVGAGSTATDWHWWIGGNLEVNGGTIYNLEGLTVEGWVENGGTISNVDTITIMGTGLAAQYGAGLYNTGTVVNFTLLQVETNLVNTGTINGMRDFSNVLVGGNIGSSGMGVGAFMPSTGIWMNLNSIIVGGNMYLGDTMFFNVGVVEAAGNINITGNVAGGYSVLYAGGVLNVGYVPETTAVFSTASLTIDAGAVAAASSILNHAGTAGTPDIPMPPPFPPIPGTPPVPGIDNWGTLSSASLIANYGVIQNNVGGTITSVGNISNFAWSPYLGAPSPGQIWNDGTITTGGMFINNILATVHNNGTIFSVDGITNAGGTIWNYGTGTITTNGAIVNYWNLPTNPNRGIIINEGTMSGTELVNWGTIEPLPVQLVTGEVAWDYISRIDNTGTITISGDITNAEYAIIDNAGTITVGGTFTNMSDGWDPGSGVYSSVEWTTFGWLDAITGVRNSGSIISANFYNYGSAVNELAGYVRSTNFTNSGDFTNSGTVTSNIFVNMGTFTNTDTGFIRSTIVPGQFGTGNIENFATMYNDGTIVTAGLFHNYGYFTGSGGRVITDGGFMNYNTGTIGGSLDIYGNFANGTNTLVGGYIVLFDGPDNLGNNGDRIYVHGGTAFINGGTVVVGYSGLHQVGQQHVFLITDKPGDLRINPFNANAELRVDAGGLIDITGDPLSPSPPGSVLDYRAFYGTRDHTTGRYIAGKRGDLNHQYYWLEASRAYLYGPQGITRNQIAVGNYIDIISSNPRSGSDLWNLLKQLDGISDDPNNPYYHPSYATHGGKTNPMARRALDELSGAIYSSIGVASVHNTGVINRTLADTLRSDVFKFSYIGNPNNAIRGQAIAPLRYTRWGNLFGIGGTSKYDGNASGYKLAFGGAMAGVDRSLWTGTRVGTYLSAATGQVSLNELDERSETTNVTVGLYLRQEMYFGYTLASMGLGFDSYKTTRDLTLLRHRAESKAQGTVGSFYLERGIDLPVYYATVQPYASFQVVAVNQDKFTETMWNQEGRYANVGLEGVSGKTDSYKMAIGARAASSPIPLPWAQLAITGNMAWFHDFANDHTFVGRFSNPGASNFGAQLSDATFRVAGNNPKQDWFNFGFGLNADRNSTRAFLTGDLFVNDQQTLFSAGGGFSRSW
jgi:hypothetical protein